MDAAKNGRGSPYTSASESIGRCTAAIPGRSLHPGAAAGLIRSERHAGRALPTNPGTFGLIPCRPFPARPAPHLRPFPAPSGAVRRHRVRYLQRQVCTHRTLQSTQSAQSVVRRLRSRYKYSEKIRNVRRASAQSPRLGTKNSRECRSRHLPGTFRLTGSGPRQGPPVPITSSCPRWSSWQPSEQQPLPKRPSGPSEQPSSCSRLP